MEKRHLFAILARVSWFQSLSTLPLFLSIDPPRHASPGNQLILGPPCAGLFLSLAGRQARVYAVLRPSTTPQAELLIAYPLRHPQRWSAWVQRSLWPGQGMHPRAPPLPLALPTGCDIWS